MADSAKKSAVSAKKWWVSKMSSFSKKYAVSAKLAESAKMCRLSKNERIQQNMCCASTTCWFSKKPWWWLSIYAVSAKIWWVSNKWADSARVRDTLIRRRPHVNIDWHLVSVARQRHALRPLCLHHGFNAVLISWTYILVVSIFVIIIYSTIKYSMFKISEWNKEN